MRIVSISILLVLLTSCGSFGYKPVAERKEDCAVRFVKLDIDGPDAAKMCIDIYQKRK